MGSVSPFRFTISEGAFLRVDICGVLQIKISDFNLDQLPHVLIQLAL
jgi:hypothetical protein